MQDRLLLRQYVKHGSQAAFAEIVRRHLRLVYGTCLREVGHRQMAEDVTQSVFLILARKAPSLGRHTPLAAWLFQTARLASRSALRQERRRRIREHQAAQIIDPAALRETRELQDDLALNEALAALSAGDREAVLLRFFEEMSFAEAGAALGVSEDTAQKRVSRAVEKMRVHLAKNGSGLSVVALTGILSAEAARAVPPGCATPVLQIIPGLKITLATSSLFGSRAYHISQGVLKSMKAKAALTAASVGALAVASVSILMAGAGGASNKIIGTWGAKFWNTPEHMMGSVTIRFNPNGTFQERFVAEYKEAHKANIGTIVGTYQLTSHQKTGAYTNALLTMTTNQAVTNGKPEHIHSPISTDTVTFSNGGKTLKFKASKWLMQRQ